MDNKQETISEELFAILVLVMLAKTFGMSSLFRVTLFSYSGLSPDCNLDIGGPLWRLVCI